MVIPGVPRNSTEMGMGWRWEWSKWEWSKLKFSGMG